MYENIIPNIYKTSNSTKYQIPFPIPHSNSKNVKKKKKTNIIKKKHISTLVPPLLIHEWKTQLFLINFVKIIKRLKKKK